jgi:hypothetical protein
MAQTVKRTKKVQIRATFIVADSRSTAKLTAFIKERQQAGDIAFINDIKLFGSEEFDALQALGCLNAISSTTLGDDEVQTIKKEDVSHDA